MILLERARWSFVGLFVVVAIAGMFAAVQLEVECELDCAPDDDVTWNDALLGAGTGLSPPAFFVLLVPALALAAGRAGGWGGAALALLAAASLVMLVAAVLDAGTVRSLTGGEGPIAWILSALLLAAVVGLGASALIGLVGRIRTRRSRGQS